MMATILIDLIVEEDSVAAIAVGISVKLHDNDKTPVVSSLDIGLAQIAIELRELRDRRTICPPE